MPPTRKTVRVAAAAEAAAVGPLAWSRDAASAPLAASPWLQNVVPLVRSLPDPPITTVATLHRGPCMRHAPARAEWGTFVRPTVAASRGLAGSSACPLHLPRPTQAPRRSCVGEADIGSSDRRRNWPIRCPKRKEACMRSTCGARAVWI
eukprot:354861-Chlamydomonas_euryale.AAC.3